MKEVESNFWKIADQHQLILVTTNGIVKEAPHQAEGPRFRLVMGAGIARQFADRFPFLPMILGFHVKNYGNTVNFTRFKDSDRLIGSFPTKNHYRDPSEPELILQCAIAIKKRVDEEGIKSVLSVRPGCGLGGLSWKDVKPLLEQAGWDDRFTIVSPPSRRSKCTTSSETSQETS